MRIQAARRIFRTIRVLKEKGKLFPAIWKYLPLPLHSSPLPHFDGPGPNPINHLLITSYRLIEDFSDFGIGLARKGLNPEKPVLLGRGFADKK